MKLFTDHADKSDAALRDLLAAELNLAITGGPLTLAADALSVGGRASVNGESSAIVANRLAVDDRFGRLFERANAGDERPASDITVVDVVLEQELRGDFVRECENLMLFDQVYDSIIANPRFHRRRSQVDAGPIAGLVAAVDRGLVDASVEEPSATMPKRPARDCVSSFSIGTTASRQRLVRAVSFGTWKNGRRTLRRMFRIRCSLSLRSCSRNCSDPICTPRRTSAVTTVASRRATSAAARTSGIASFRPIETC